MRILKEEANSKENLPVSFITDMMSKGWDEVGYLREASAAIKETYNDTSKVETLMQDLMDAYLVFIGQLEAYLNKEENIATITDLEKEVVKDSTNPVDSAEIENKTALVQTEPEELENAKVEEPSTELPEAEFEVEPIEFENSHATAEDPFEFFTDFDEPDMSSPPITDSDLYDENNKPKVMLRS